MMPMALISTPNTECCYVVGDVIGIVVSTYMTYHIQEVILENTHRCWHIPCKTVLPYCAW